MSEAKRTNVERECENDEHQILEEQQRKKEDRLAKAAKDAASEKYIKLEDRSHALIIDEPADALACREAAEQRTNIMEQDAADAEREPEVRLEDARTSKRC